MYRRKYSGLGRRGICICGHSWKDHHLCLVLQQKYIDATQEYYIPQECEFYGCNEVGGMIYEDGEWKDHCHGYIDTEEDLCELEKS